MKRVFPRLRRATGLALVTAIFLLVGLAGLGVAIVSVVTAQQASSSLDQQSAAAYQSARAGLEWALWQQLHTGVPALPCPAPISFDMPAGTTLSAFRVTVQCTVPDAGGRIQLLVVACNQPAGGNCPNPAPGNEYVQRQLQAVL